MAKLPSAFNAEANEKLGDFTPIPAGSYLAHIKKSEMKATKNGQGSYLQLTFEILEGENLGKTVIGRLNIQNPNIQATQIAQKTLATICECVGIKMLEDTEELHGKPMYINVTVKPGDAQYAAQNEIKGYSPADGTGPTPVTLAPKGAAPAAKQPPWKRA